MTTRSAGAWGWLTGIKYAHGNEPSLWYSYAWAVSWRATALGSEPIASARDGATGCAQDPEDHTDDNQDAADCVQDAEVWNKKSDDDQDNAEDDHDDSVQLVWWCCGKVIGGSTLRITASK
jgi:hypothetical protein